MFGSMGLRSVFNDVQRVVLGQLPYGFDVGHLTVEVHGHDDFRAIGDLRPHGLRIQREVLRTYVAEAHRRTRFEDGIKCRNESERARNHFVARCQSECLDRSYERCRAIIYRDRVVRADDLGKPGLELGHHGPLGDGAGANNAQDALFDSTTEADG